MAQVNEVNLRSVPKDFGNTVKMAKLVGVYDDDEEVTLGRRQLPLSVYDNKIVSITFWCLFISQGWPLISAFHDFSSLGSHER